MESLFGADRYDGYVELLHAVPGWPADEVKDRMLVQQLLKQYPQMDLAGEISKWAAWMLDHESRKKVRHRARFANWCGNADRWSREGHRGRHGSGRTSTGGTPSTTFAGSGFRPW